MREILLTGKAIDWTKPLQAAFPEMTLRGLQHCSLDDIAQHTACLVLDVSRSRDLGTLEALLNCPAPIVGLCRDGSQAEEVLKHGAFEALVASSGRDALELAVFKSLREDSQRRRLQRLSLEKERLERLCRSRKERIQELREVGRLVRSITSSLYIEDILTGVLDGIRTALRLDSVVLGLVNSDTGLEEVKLALGVESSKLTNAAWKVDHDSPIWRRIHAKGGPILVDPSKEESLPPFIRGIYQGEFVKVPMAVKHQLLGTIMCNRHKPRLSQRDLRQLRDFAEYAAIAIQNGRLYYEVIRSEDQLRRTQRQLVDAEKMALIGQMAISINHEINNPLCNISMITQMMADELRDRCPRMFRLLRDVDDNIDRIQKVTQKISGLRQAPLTEYLPDQMMVDLQ